MPTTDPYVNLVQAVFRQAVEDLIGTGEEAKAAKTWLESDDFEWWCRLLQYRGISEARFRNLLLLQAKRMGKDAGKEVSVAA